MIRTAVWLSLALHVATATAQDSGATVQVLHETAPVRGVSVESEGMRAVTDVRGVAKLALAAGSHELRLARDGFAAIALPIEVHAGEDTPVTVQLAAQSLEDQVVVVTATRSGTVVGDQPLRVEAVPEEEIEENLTVQPGNVSTLLAELAGVRIAATAPGLGGATLQIRGMPGRHTEVLSDGLPLIGDEPGGFGLLQTPPLDLGRVEVIKGIASALYGGSALGGVLNLVSRRPGGEPEVLLSQSSRGGTDLVGFAGWQATPALGFTVTGGAHRQERKDLDDDGWADLAHGERSSIRPRLWYEDEAGRSLFLTAGYVDEDRDGGTLAGQALPDGSSFDDALRTRRLDGGAVGRIELAGGRVLGARLSATRSEHDRTYGTANSRDTQHTAFAETTLAGRNAGHSWVLGAAFERDRLEADDVPGVGYTYDVPAVFAQDEFAPAEKLILSASGRLDRHSDEGTFFSPRLAVAFLPNGQWTIRASAGAGFAAPTPFVDEIESTGLTVLVPLADLKAERARGVSLDAQWVLNGWEVDVSAFGSEIRHALDVQPAAAAGMLELVNANRTRRVLGTEALLRYVAGALHVIGSYTLLDATEGAPGGGRQDVDRIPRHSAELAALLEDEARGRIGVEFSWTGRQALDDNPFRIEGKSYLEINALAEVKFGETAIFLNGINLTDRRQARFDPLLRPTPGPAGQPVTEIWAPVEGRVFNLGVRLEF